MYGSSWHVIRIRHELLVCLSEHVFLSLHDRLLLASLTCYPVITGTLPLYFTLHTPIANTHTYTHTHTITHSHTTSSERTRSHFSSPHSAAEEVREQEAGTRSHRAIEMDKVRQRRALKACVLCFTLFWVTLLRRNLLSCLVH